MIRIAIVDDEAVFIKNFQKEIVRLFRLNNISCKITSYTNGKEFLKKYQETEFDLIFLDIDIPDISGIEIASGIREKNSNPILIFVSAHDNFVFESIHYAPFRFIRKTNLLMDTEEAIKSFCNHIKDNERYISLDLEEKNDFLANIAKIMYFFSQRHSVYMLNKENEVVRLAARTYTMDKLEELVKDKGFIRIHKTYIVNCMYIYKIKSEKVILIDNSEIPLSRIRAAAAKEQYQIFLRRNDTL